MRRAPASVLNRIEEARRLRRVAFLNQSTQTLGSLGPWRIKVGTVEHLFEFHGVCGPVLLDRNEDPLRKQPGARSPFWPAFEKWRRAGCFVDKDGWAYVPSDRIMGSEA